MPFEHAVELAAPRASSEDRATVFHTREGLVIALADGAGGTSNGAAAAQAVIDAVGAAVARDEPVDSAALLEELDASPALRGGQTTAVIVSLTADGITGASVGDSGAWLLGDQLVDLTHRQHRKPLLGSGALITPFEAPPLGDRTLLVASDGLLSCLPLARIAQIAVPRDLIAASRSLVGELKRTHRGLTDDVAIVLCRMAAEAMP